MKYQNRGKSINDLLNMLVELEQSSQLLANDLTRDDERRAYSKGCADTYAACRYFIDQRLGLLLTGNDTDIWRSNEQTNS